MPLAGLLCPCRKCDGAEQPVAKALDHLSKRNDGQFTYELMASMLATVQDREDRISTTTLTSKCLRSEFLKRKEPYVEDPKRMYASFRGTMFHGQLERFAHPQAIAEARYHVDNALGLGPLSGSPDLIDPKTGHLYDYKFTKENPRWERAWGDHVEQLQVNRWLVDKADRVEFQGFEFNMDDRANQARFRPIDWQGLIVMYLDDKGPKPILITRSEQVQKKTGPGTKAVRVADIWSDDRVESYITERYVAAQTALKDNVLPDITPAYEGWQHPLCGFCPKKTSCIDHFIEDEVNRRLDVLHEAKYGRKAS